MGEIRPILTFATQGGEFSYHAVAATKAAGGLTVAINEKEEFGDVVRASRSMFPGLGVIAISTVAGTVDASAKEIVRKRPSALPPIVGRVDVPVELALIGAQPQSIESVARRGVRCLAQKPAAQQCAPFLREQLPWIKLQYRGESTRAIKEVVQRSDPNYVAIGPSFAAEPLGGVIIGPRQINPVGSITSFYVLQRDPRQQRLPAQPDKTSKRTVISLGHPEGEGEFTKTLEIARMLGVGVARFIPFDIGDFTKHNSGLRRGGGIFELNQDLYDEQVTEWCARVNGLPANDGVEGAFTTKRLGGYDWYPEESLDLQNLAATFDTGA